MEKECQAALEEERLLQEEKASGEAQLEQKRKEIQENEIELFHREKDLEQLGKEISQFQEKMDVLQFEEKQLEEEKDEIEREKEAVRRPDGDPGRGPEGERRGRSVPQAGDGHLETRRLNG